MTNSAHTQAPITALEKGYAIVDSLTKISQTHNSSISAVALAWIRANKEVSTPIASARTVEQLHEIVPIVQLTAYEVASLSECQPKLCITSMRLVRVLQNLAGHLPCKEPACIQLDFERF